MRQTPYPFVLLADVGMLFVISAPIVGVSGNGTATVIGIERQTPKQKIFGQCKQQE